MAAHVVDPLVVRALVASVHLGGDHVARAPVGQQPPEADEHTGGGLDITVLGRRTALGAGPAADRWRTHLSPSQTWERKVRELIGQRARVCVVVPLATMPA